MWGGICLTGETDLAIVERRLNAARHPNEIVEPVKTQTEHLFAVRLVGALGLAVRVVPFLPIPSQNVSGVRRRCQAVVAVYGSPTRC